MEIIDNSFAFKFNIDSYIGNKVIRLCLFDLDNTLIETKSGKVFPEDRNDYKLLYENVLDIIKENYQNENDFFCIISNQRNLLKEKKRKQKDDFFYKLEEIENECKKKNIQCNYFISFEDDYYRKPLTGSFEFIKNKFKLNGNKINKSTSFFCGDACGRINDFSSSDLFYASNCKFLFYTPQHVFLGEPLPTFQFPSQTFLQCIDKPLPKIKVNNLFFIMIMGPPTSGKSYLGNLLQNKYGGIILETEKIKTIEKMEKKIEESIQNIKSVIVIGTYPKKENRKRILKKVKDLENDINIYGIEMKVSKELMYHLNSFRVESSENRIKKIPDVAYRVYFKEYDEPTQQDGFQQIYQYSPCFHFSNKKLDEMFHFYY